MSRTALHIASFIWNIITHSPPRLGAPYPYPNPPDSQLDHPHANKLLCDSVDINFTVVPLGYLRYLVTILL